jgi:integrase
MDEQNVYRMRHTFCSSLYEDGFEKRDIKDLMGHDNEITFQTVYAHRLDPEATSKAVADKMNNLFSKRRKTASPRRRSPAFRYGAGASSFW